MDGSLAARGSARDPSPTLNLHGTKTILIAEDHDSIREMVRQSLVGLGYRVLAASDGQQAALRLCETDTPALAILDVIMPRLGGPASAAALLTSRPNLPVLFTSGSPNPPALPAYSFLRRATFRSLTALRPGPRRPRNPGCRPPLRSRLN